MEIIMAEITAALVKDLREKSGVGMMDCKKALIENNGDIEASIDWLRAKGLSKAAKKADRAAAEGLVGVLVEGTTGVVVELNAETDFVSRNDQFQAAVTGITKIALGADSIDALNAMPAPSGEGTVNDFVTNLIATVGENMTLRRMAKVSVGSGVVASYIHTSTGDGVGRIGVLVGVETTGDAAAATDIGRKVAMHIAATSPLSLKIDDLDAAVVERERQVLTEQARESGKPENVIENMIKGRIRKFYEEVVLLQQPFVMNPDQTVEAFVADSAKAAGFAAEITGFAMFKVGDGVEKKEEGDFASEVAALTGG
jgi:elongation factor Ts